MKMKYTKAEVLAALETKDVLFFQFLSLHGLELAYNAWVGGLTGADVDRAVIEGRQRARCRPVGPSAEAERRLPDA